MMLTLCYLSDPMTRPDSSHMAALKIQWGNHYRRYQRVGKYKTIRAESEEMLRKLAHDIILTRMLAINGRIVFGMMIQPNLVIETELILEPIPDDDDLWHHNVTIYARGWSDVLAAVKKYAFAHDCEVNAQHTEFRVYPLYGHYFLSFCLDNITNFRKSVFYSVF